MCATAVAVAAGAVRLAGGTGDASATSPPRPAAARAAPAPPAATLPAFDAAVRALEELPYQPDYVPEGYDSAFPSGSVRNDFPVEDYTDGSVPGTPDAPAFPPSFRAVTLRSPDGAEFFAEVALQPHPSPAVVVVPGFNTNSKESVVRWAAMLADDGYSVIAADQRDFAAEYQAGDGYPAFVQTFGWKEAEDVVTAARYLAAQRGVRSLGIVGVSEGAQNAILAMADAPGLFAAGITFSAPADQDTQIYSTAVPPGCASPACAYPATDALVDLVVPPYDWTGVCAALTDAASVYKTTGFYILARESAFHAQRAITVPLLNFYSADDSLVPSFEASMTAGYEAGRPLQRTLLVSRGEHAYFYDRWWQQEAILRYFKALLPGAAGDPRVTTRATVNETAGGAPLWRQLVPLGSPTPAQADAHLAPYVCDTAQGPPGG
jgi:hypothetical protein